jgi:hypothetical protein
VSFQARAADEPLYVFGGEGHREFLGCLNCSSSHPKSVWNDSSQFGFRNDFGVWSRFRFASEFGSTTMCSQFASDPPIVVDEQGNAYGRLSINEYAPGSVCSVNGSEQLCRAVRAICAAKQ